MKFSVKSKHLIVSAAHLHLQLLNQKQSFFKTTCEKRTPLPCETNTLFALSHACFTPTYTPGGGAQRSARTASGSKPKPPKPPVRMESLPPPAAKLLNIAPAALLPQSASVAMDPAVMLGAHNTQTASAATALPATAVSIFPPASAPASASAQLQKIDVEMADRANLDERNSEMQVADGQPTQNPSSGADNQSHRGDSCSPSGLPQLTVSSSRVVSDADRPLARTHSKTSFKNGRAGSLSKGNTPRASIGRPPRSGSGIVHRQDSVASDKKESRKLLRRNTTG